MNYKIKISVSQMFEIFEEVRKLENVYIKDINNLKRDIRQLEWQIDMKNKVIDEIKQNKENA